MNVPSGYTALDLIGFTDRGDYSSSANYVKNDLVHSGGRVWLCLVDDTTNITPAVGANWKIWIDEAAYLSGLADTTITSPIDGQVLRYDIATNKWVNASVDSSPTQSSTNLVQSGGVYTQLANKANTSDLATVATTGAYSDLSGKPNLAAVATSGSYNDLLNKPMLGTAAAKDSTNAVTQNSTDLVESGAVYSEVNTVKQALANKTDRNILIFGNSYVDRGCAAKLRAMFTNSMAFTGSGTGFLTYTGHTTDVFEALLTQAVASSSVDNDSITDIIFVSAMGDTRARAERGFTAFENELTAAITSCVNIINANFTNCKRISITFAETRNVVSFSDYPNPYSALFDVHKTFRKICGSLGVDYLGWSGFNSLFVSADLDSDHYHPTPTGASHIGQFIKDSYYGSAEYMTKQSQASCNFGGQSGKTMTCVARLLPDSCSLNVRYVALSSGSISVSPSNPVVDLSALPIPLPAPNPTIDFRVILYEISTSNDVMKIPVNISNNDDGVAVIKTTYTLSETIASNMNALLAGLELFSYII